MKYILGGLLCLTLSYIIVDTSLRTYRFHLAKKAMISFFRKYKKYMSGLIVSQVISHEEFDEIKMKIVELAVDELSKEELLLISPFLNMDEENKAQDLKNYNDFFLKSGSLNSPLRFVNNPLERIDL